MSKLSSQIQEFFLMRGAAAGARNLAPDHAGRARACLERHRAQHKAAETLLAAGQRAAAVGCAALALRQALDALAEVAGGRAAEVWQRWLVENAWPPERVTALLACQVELDRLPPALSDAEVAETHLQLTEHCQQTSQALSRVLWPYACSQREIQAVSLTRQGVTAVLVAGLVWAGWTMLRPDPWAAQASAMFGGGDPRYSPDRVVDGRTATEWLLPDGTAGWLEIKATRPKDVARVRILNAHNAPFNDRATRDFRVELYSGNTLVASRDAAFAELAVLVEWLELDLPAKNVDRIRITVRNHHGKGAGLAEVEVR